MKRMKLLFTLALPVILLQNVQAQSSHSGAERTTSSTTISVLTGISDWLSNGVNFYVVDSTIFDYSNGRGGDLTHTMKYDNKHYFVYDVADSLWDLNNTWNQQTYYSGTNNIWYNTLENLVGSTWVPQTRYVYSYDAGNKITNQVFQNWTGSLFLSASEDNYSYVAGTSLLFSDEYYLYDASSLTFIPNSEKSYYYDGYGNLLTEYDVAASGTSWVPTQEFVYTYDSSNRVVSKTFARSNGGVYINSYMYSYIYNPSNGDLVSTLYQTYDTSSGQWVNNTLSLYLAFDGSNPTTQQDEVWDTSSGGMWVYNKLYTYTYNSFGQMTSKTAESYNVSLPGFEYAAGDPLTYYYYNTVVINGVKAVENTGFDVSVFPVPAQNMLHISLTSNDAISYDVTIVDMTGRIVKSWSIPASTKYNTVIPTDNFAQGNYFVTINSEKGQVTKQITVIR